MFIDDDNLEEDEIDEGPSDGGDGKAKGKGGRTRASKTPGPQGDDPGKGKPDNTKKQPKRRGGKTQAKKASVSQEQALATSSAGGGSTDEKSVPKPRKVISKTRSQFEPQVCAH